MASAVRCSRWLASIAVVLCAGLVPATGVAAAGPAPRRAADVTPHIDPLSGRPGDPVVVLFKPEADGGKGCRAGFAEPLTRCVAERPGKNPHWIVKLTVPFVKPQQIPLYWDAEERLDPDKGQEPVPSPSPSPARQTWFTVLEPDFRVTADRTGGFQDAPVVVSFASPTKGVAITRCRVRLGANQRDCSPQGVTAKVAVPGTGDGQLHADLWYSVGRDNDIEAHRDIRFVIRPPPSEPDFSVVADPPSAGPGDLVTVSFTSRTKGVTVATCSARFGNTVACVDGTSVVLRVPTAARPTTTITLAWNLTYRSTRPGEQVRPRSGEIPFLVGAVSRPRFVATVEPREAHAGDRVTVTLTSLNNDFTILGCLVAFPSAVGDVCRRSPRRWFAETRVPRDARPGMTILRWGVASRSTDGQAGADNDSVEYRVLPQPPPTKRATPPATTTTATPIRTGQVTGPVEAVPRFVAMTDPESAAPGESVTVTVTPSNPATEIRSCSVTFAGATGRPCRPGAGGWAATVKVPAGAEPGVLALDWDVISSAGNGGGTIDYRVLGKDEPPPVAFSVTPQPGAARAGSKVIVSARALVDDVSITSCSTGFTDETMTPCRPTAGGWTTDLTVPAAMPVGPTKVLWRLAYGRAGGGPVDARGFSTFTVLDKIDKASGTSWWGLFRTVVQLLGGAVFLAALIGWRLFAKRFRGSRAARRVAPAVPDGDAGIPSTVSVVTLHDRDRMYIGAPDRSAPAGHLFTIVRHNPRTEPRITEERP
jgi:hypothetical protein